jgi:hypothetical protein
MYALKLFIQRTLMLAVMAAVTMTAACSSSGSNVGNPDAGGTGADASGGCQSTMPHCDTCMTMAQNPLNACSSAVDNCLPFDETRVPKGPDGKVPQVP